MFVNIPEKVNHFYTAIAWMTATLNHDELQRILNKCQCKMKAAKHESLFDGFLRKKRNITIILKDVQNSQRIEKMVVFLNKMFN